MAEVKIEVDHQLSQDQAVSRLERLLKDDDGEDALFRGMDVARRGVIFSFSGKIKGFNVSGKIKVFDKELAIVIIVPWAARPFHEPASKYIREYLKAKLA